MGSIIIIQKIIKQKNLKRTQLFKRRRFKWSGRKI